MEFNCNVLEIICFMLINITVMNLFCSSPKTVYLNNTVQFEKSISTSFLSTNYTNCCYSYTAFMLTRILCFFSRTTIRVISVIGGLLFIFHCFWRRASFVKYFLISDLLDINELLKDLGVYFFYPNQTVLNPL